MVPSQGVWASRPPNTMNGLVLLILVLKLFREVHELIVLLLNEVILFPKDSLHILDLFYQRSIGLELFVPLLLESLNSPDGYFKITCELLIRVFEALLRFSYLRLWISYSLGSNHAYLLLHILFCFFVLLFFGTLAIDYVVSKAADLVMELLQRCLISFEELRVLSCSLILFKLQGRQFLQVLRDLLVFGLNCLLMCL